MCFGRVFLSRRTAAFDLAAAGVLVAALGRRRGPVLWSAPYLALAVAEARPWGPRLGPRVAVVGAVADAAGAAALLAGALHGGSAVL